MNYLRIWELAALQRGHVAAQSKLLAVQAFKIFLELELLGLQRLTHVCIADDTQLQVVHMFKLGVLWRKRTKWSVVYCFHVCGVRKRLCYIAFNPLGVIYYSVNDVISSRLRGTCA